MRNFFYLLLTIGWWAPLAQANDHSKPFERPLWQGAIPNAIETNNIEYEDDCFGVVCAYDISQPTLSFYPATSANTGKAILIIPGGGYEVEAIYHEGHDVAQYFAARGVSAAVLKYRLPHPDRSQEPWLAPLLDARQALNLLHEIAADYHIDPSSIGVMGFSAGSHLAVTLAEIPSDRTTEIPDFSMLIYGVTRMNDENTQWLETSLFHRPMTDEEVAKYRFIEQADDNSPPAFFVHAMDDTVCHYHESLLYFESLEASGVDVEMHLFSSGGHGFGLGRTEDGTDAWPELALSWLERLNTN